MNQLVHGRWNGRQVEVMRRTMCADATDAEFLQFLEYASAKHLDPFVGQVILVVYNKDNPKKRKTSIITTQAGMRVLAQRCGNHRPDPKEIEYTYDESLKGPANPLGLVKASTHLYIQDNKGDWYPVNGTVYWDEFAPIKEQWADDPDSGRRKPTGRKTVEGNWAKMGRVMLGKCATMRALTAGWPDVFSGVTSEEERGAIENVADVDALQLIEHEREERRLKQIGHDKEVHYFFNENGDPVHVPAGQFADAFLQMAKQYTTKEKFEHGVRGRNKDPFNLFWAKHKDDALQLKKELEKIEAKLVS
jgi:phage recombination protein Bet